MKFYSREFAFPVVRESIFDVSLERRSSHDIPAFRKETDRSFLLHPNFVRVPTHFDVQKFLVKNRIENLSADVDASRSARKIPCHHRISANSETF